MPANDAAPDGGAAPRLSRADVLLRVVLVAFSAYFVVDELFLESIATPGGDFDKHWIAARLIVRGENPYPGDYLGLNYPMFVSALYLPMAVFPDRESAHLAWKIAHGIVAVAVALACAFGLRPAPVEHRDPARRFVARHWPYLAFALVAAYGPLHKTLSAGNLDPMLLLIATILAILSVRGRDRSAGVAFAALSLTKLIPALLAVPLLFLGRRRLLSAAAATLGGYAALLLATGWWRWEWFYVTDVLPQLTYHWRGISVSFHRFAMAVLLPQADGDPQLYTRVAAAINVALLAAWCGAFHLARRRRADEEVVLACGFAMLLSLSPVVETIHFSWILPALFLHLRAWLRGALAPWAAVACGIGWIAAFNVQTFSNVAGTMALGFPVWYSETFVLAAVVAGSACAMLARPRG